jgi:hypothetical protein
MQAGQQAIPEIRKAIQAWVADRMAAPTAAPVR